MTSLPGNRTQQNMETGFPGLTAERSPQPVRRQPGCFTVCSFPEAGPLRCVGMQSVLPKDPPERPLAPCLKKQKGNTGAPARARSPLPSYPGNPESFPCVCGWGFPGVSPPQASPCRCGQKSVGWVRPHPRAEQVGWDGESPGSTGCPGRPQALRGVSFLQGEYLNRHMFLLAAEFRAGRSSRHTGQAQLSKLQAGLADGQCHFRASQSMWPMRWAPCSPPRVRRQITTTLPVRPSAVSM